MILLLGLCAAAPAQTRILLYDFEARGVDVSVIRANTQVLRDALNGTYKYLVVDPAPGTFCYNLLAAADSARHYGAAQALIGNIMSIGGKQFLTYQLVDAGSSTLMLADKLELPPMDEFPTMAERVAAAIVKKKPLAQTIEPGNVLETEVNGPALGRQRKPYTGILLTAGYGYFAPGRQSSSATSLFNLDMALSLETRRTLTMLQIGCVVSDEPGIEYGLLSHYVPGRGDLAPFYGGGLSISGFASSGDALIFYAGGGVIGLRTYNFRFLAAAYLSLATGGSEGPSGPGVRVLFGVSAPSFCPEPTTGTGSCCI